MTVLGWRGDSMVLARARVPPCPDALRARRELERLLADADWRGASLPADAVLLVRHVALPAHEPATEPAPLGVRVGRELRRQAASARRPWVQTDAAAAEAVLFADEAELLACLARDWLLGRVAAHWWWREILSGASPARWLCGHALRRGEMFVAVAGKLAASGHVVEWVEQLDPDETRAALAAIERAYGLRLADDARDPVETSLSVRSRREAVSAVEPTQAAPSVAEISRLAILVPEAFKRALAGPQRRVLGLVLGILRAPAWSRSRSFARALHAIDGHPAHPVAAPPEDRALRGPSSAPAPPGRVIHPRTESQMRDEGKRGIVEPAPETTRFELGKWLVRAASATATEPIPGDSVAPSRELRIDPIADGATEVMADRGASASRIETPAQRDIDGADPSSYALDVWPGGPYVPLVTTIKSVGATRIATGFGGLFYLLNAALAMGLYADFTSPRAANLELSPWDWLAWIGREWFGAEFVEDAAWRALAELAGRTPEQAPERDFVPPSPDWLRQHLAALRARLAAALDAGEGVNVFAFLCRCPAQIEVSATTVHVFLSLARLDLAIRIAGLDRDTGWIPAAGRAVRFHFD